MRMRLGAGDGAKLDRIEQGGHGGFLVVVRSAYALAASDNAATDAPSRPPARFAFPALILANLVLAAGRGWCGWPMSGRWRPASGGWRWPCPSSPSLALAAEAAAGPFPAGPWSALIALGGLFFAADLAAWHDGILRTKLANATLFGNFASFLFAIYGFILLRSLPGRVQGAGAAARRGRHGPAARAAASSCRPTISPATCSPCSPAFSTPSI